MRSSPNWIVHNPPGLEAADRGQDPSARESSARRDPARAAK